ncbi:MAG: hypothetical protein ABIS51_05805 [Sphingomonas sp.]
MTPQGLETLDFVRVHIQRMGVGPRYQEIGEAFGIGPVAAFYRVEKLVEAGQLQKGPRGSLELVGTPDLRTVDSAALRAELARRGEIVGALAVPERHVMGRRAVTCAAPCCDIEVPMGHLMCRDHWLSLPFELRQDLLRAHSQARRSGTPDDAQFYGDLVDQARELTGRQRAAA